MSLRHLALYFFVAFLSIYAWKDWIKSLCGLILIMAVIEHESMPKNMFGIQGFNMWNILFLAIFLVWLVKIRNEGPNFQLPRHITILLLMYLGVIIFGVLRAVFDRTNIGAYPFSKLISDLLINVIKWIIPGILLFYGCRTRRGLLSIIACLLIMYFLIATQVVLRLPASSVLHADSNIDQTRRACSKIGYSAVDMSAFLAGAFWAIVSVLTLVRQKKYKLIILGSAGVVLFGQALTGGRAGYLAWGMTGLVLCLLKWRKYLILAPLVIIILPILFPGAVGRMLEGFGQTDASGQASVDEYSATSGRAEVWPYVIDKIRESPYIGHGRMAMNRLGLYDQMTQLGYNGFGHPHNMYLEALLDNGIIGAVPIFLFWLILVFYAAILFRSSNRLCSAVGGISLSLMLTQLFAGIGSQHFYPEESTFGVWTAMFLMLRVYLEQSHSQAIISTIKNDMQYEESASMAMLSMNQYNI